MIEKVLVISIGLLVAFLPFAALLAVDGWRVRRWLRRTRKFYAVYWRQMDDTERAFWRWYGRAAWVSLLVVVAVL